ncbi:MAG: MFS transporter [Lachnospiraceae bacterium]|nr:MFS transporter [Lachnospiraceae bacterium]
MLFAPLPMHAAAGSLMLIAVLIVLFDCIMTFAGSTSNDAAFNAWVADNTDDTNRGKLNGILSFLPVIAVVIVFVGLSKLYEAGPDGNNAPFFIVIGCIPLAAGLLALFTLKDAPTLKARDTKDTVRDTFYGFRSETVKNNKMLYITLLAACLIGIAQQTFFSYLINFLIITLGLGDMFVIPMAIIIVGSAVVTGILGFMFDKFGRRRFYYPMLAMAVLGILSFFSLKYLDGTVRMVVLNVGGIVMMGGILSLIGAFNANFQDCIPKGSEGRFQGVRMCFTVLIPMIIGPVISLILGLDAMGMNGSNFAPPYSLYVAAAIVALLAVIPIALIRKGTDR